MNNEKNTGSNNESAVEFSKDNLQELHEQQRNRIETAGEQESRNSHENAAKARHEVEKAIQEKESKKPESAAETSVERKVNTAAGRKKAYDKILKQTQAELPAASRAFSKVLHNPVVERVSETAGKTVVRPNAILSGAVSAFLLTLAVYLIAKFNGYPLTGTETIAAFIAGWIIGNVYDFFKAMITGKR